MENRSSNFDDVALRERVRELVATEGQYATAMRLGLHPQTVLALAAGVRVMRGTLALARASLGQSASRCAEPKAAVG